MTDLETTWLVLVVPQQTKAPQKGAFVVLKTYLAGIKCFIFILYIAKTLMLFM